MSRSFMSHPLHITVSAHAGDQPSAGPLPAIEHLETLDSPKARCCVRQPSPGPPIAVRHRQLTVFELLRKLGSPVIQGRIQQPLQAGLSANMPKAQPPAHRAPFPFVPQWDWRWGSREAADKGCSHFDVSTIQT